MRRTARELLDAEGVRLNSFAIGEHRAACPKCVLNKPRVKDDALAVKIDEKGFQAHCHRCGWGAFGFYDTREAGQREAPRIEPPSVASDVTNAEDRERDRKRAFDIWTASVPIAGTPGEKYFRRRAIKAALPAHCLRFNADAWHKELGGPAPAVIAALVDVKSNTFAGIHRTWIKPDGSGKIEDVTARKMYGRAKGAAIKLTRDDAVEQGLCIGEGVETCLSLYQAGYPIWALGDADGVESFPVLAGVSLTIFADPDPRGMIAARVCATRWSEAGEDVRILAPSYDWNDWARSAA